MKKNNNNRGKAAIGAVLAAGMTAGAITAGCGKAAQYSQTSPVQSQESNVELTAADAVVIDGKIVEIDDVNNNPPRRDVAKPMYGVRQNPIHLMYGPRPRPGMRPALPTPDKKVDSPATVELGVYEIVASTLDVNVRNVGAMTELRNLSSKQRKQLKVELESRFDVTIPNDTFSKLRTVGDIVNTICSLKF